MRKLFLLFAVIAAVIAALMSLGSTATADTAVSGKAVTRASEAQALSCPGGSLCIWPVTDGSGNRCSWSNADNDWWNAPIICSWSSSRTVRAIYNNGTSTSYAGVCLYRGASHTSFEIYLPQSRSTTLGIGVIMRSHKWIRPGQSC